MFSRCAVGEEDFGELSIEDGLDEDKVVSEEDAAEAQKLKGQANTAFSRKSDLLPLSGPILIAPPPTGRTTLSGSYRTLQSSDTA